MSNRSRRKNVSPRKITTRYSGDIVLIICEGTQTEPNYLTELKDYLSLDQAAIHIIPSPGSAVKRIYYTPYNSQYSIQLTQNYLQSPELHC